MENVCRTCWSYSSTWSFEVFAAVGKLLTPQHLHVIIPYNMLQEDVGICIMTVMDLWNVCLGVFVFPFVFYLSAIQCWICMLSFVCHLNIWSKIWVLYELEHVLLGAMNSPMTFNVSWKSFSNNTSKCFPLLFGWCCYFRKANGSWHHLELILQTCCI